MRIAFLNLCHCDPDMVARTTRRLTEHPDFDMFVHVDAKSDIAPFRAALADCARTTLLEQRQPVFWGGFNAVKATVALLRTALAAPRSYEYFVLLQNLDYPIRSNRQIDAFFTEQAGTEFIRACNIAHTKDWHFSRKYRIYNQRDDEFYLTPHAKPRMYLRYLRLLARSLPTLLWNGVITEGNEQFPIYYGAAQWAISRSCAEYLVEFYESHPEFNRRMAHIQFPDEEYFHTAVHNSPFREKCVRKDEPERRWLVNWRNIHYFEYPREITVFTEQDFDRIMAQQDALFIRKVRTGVSDRLIDLIDDANKE